MIWWIHCLLGFKKIPQRSFQFEEKIEGVFFVEGKTGFTALGAQVIHVSSVIFYAWDWGALVLREELGIQKTKAVSLNGTKKEKDRTLDHSSWRMKQEEHSGRTWEAWIPVLSLFFY